MENSGKRINKFLSESGYCSRREADKLISEGRVTINGIVPEMGTKISEADEIRVDGKLIRENKEKPELQCNGKCQLMKEMAKAAEEESANDKSNSADKKENHKNIEILFYTEIKSLVSNQTRVQNQNTVIDNYSNLYSYKTSFSIFHPPAVLS